MAPYTVLSQGMEDATGPRENPPEHSGEDHTETVPGIHEQSGLSLVQTKATSGICRRSKEPSGLDS